VLVECEITKYYILQENLQLETNFRNKKNQ